MTQPTLIPDLLLAIPTLKNPGFIYCDSLAIKIDKTESKYAGPDLTSPEGYLKSVERNLNKFFPGIQTVLGGEQVEDLRVPYMALRMERVEHSIRQDKGKFFFSITLYWRGSGAPTIQHQLYSWAYRRFAFSEDLMGETGEYLPERGTIDFTISWSLPIENDYDFNPLIIDNCKIREINITVEKKWA